MNQRTVYIIIFLLGLSIGFIFAGAISKFEFDKQMSKNLLIMQEECYNLENQNINYIPSIGNWSVEKLKVMESFEKVEKD